MNRCLVCGFGDEAVEKMVILSSDGFVELVNGIRS